MNNKKNIIVTAIMVLSMFASVSVNAAGLFAGLAEHAIAGALEKITESRSVSSQSGHSFASDQKNRASLENNASSSLCVLSYLDGAAPKILSAVLAQNTQSICYPGYSTLFSGTTRTPLWSGNHLTKERVTGACSMKRKDAFHSYANLPAGMRSELSDFVRSGLDRGHLVSSADSIDASTQADTFSLANMIPQVHENNAGIWEEFENGARNLAMSGHDVYVVSGPLFQGTEVKQLNHRVMIPTHVFKAVYDASNRQSSVYIMTNDKDQDYKVISANELTNWSGIDVFPSVPPELKSQTTNVISPSQRTNCGGIKKIGS